MEFTQAGMTVLPMDELRQNSVMAGLGMFELRGFIGEHRSPMILGFYNVATRIDTSSGRPEPSVTWHTGNEAIIRAESRANGVGVAYIPDDPWWHNRVKLLSFSKVYDIIALHTNKGVLPGTSVKKQMTMLRDRLMEETTVYRILKDGMPVSDRNTKKEAERELDSFKMVRLQMDSTTGIQKPIDINTSEYEIVEVKGIGFRKEILDLEKKYRGLQYGWTECLEFQKIQEEIMAKFNEIEAVPAIATPEASLKDALGGLSKAEKIALLKNILSDDKPEEEKPKKSKNKPEEVEV